MPRSSISPITASGIDQMYEGLAPEKPSSSKGFMMSASVGCVAAATLTSKTASTTTFQCLPTRLYIRRHNSVWTGSDWDDVVLSEIGRASCRERVCQYG